MCNHHNKNFTRRDFLNKTSLGLGAVALNSLISPSYLGASTLFKGNGDPILGKPHFPPKVKRVIYLFQSGAPSQIDLFDNKPLLREMNGQNLPDSVRGNQRL